MGVLVGVRVGVCHGWIKIVGEGVAVRTGVFVGTNGVKTIAETFELVFNDKTLTNKRIKMDRTINLFIIVVWYNISYNLSNVLSLLYVKNYDIH